MAKKIPAIDLIPTPVEFYLEHGLYRPISLDNLGIEGVLRIEFLNDSLETYCVDCGRDSIFRSLERSPTNAGTPIPVEKVVTMETIYHGLGHIPVAQYAFRDREFTTSFLCSRNKAHRLDFICRVGGSTLQKIGQYPSLADIGTGNLKNYRRVISKEQSREFNKAVGLFAHGIGAGSFVYLRRVFENEIEIARQQASNLPIDYAALRMDEKIQSLKDFLPEKLVKNRAIYSILSRGIHELSEDECNRYFPAVRAGIELILEEKLEKIEHEEREREVENAIAAIKGEIAT